MSRLRSHPDTAGEHQEPQAADLPFVRDGHPPLADQGLADAAAGIGTGSLTLPSVDHVEEMAEHPLTHLFFARAARHVDDVAFRYKDLGIWQEVSWAEYRAKVVAFALGLRRLGLEAGDRVAIMGDPVPEWLYADLAAQCLGSPTYGIYVTTSPEEVNYLVSHGGARFFVAENQEYVDKLLQGEPDEQTIERIIVADDRGMFAYDDPRLLRFDEVLRLGEDWAAKGGVPELEEIIATRRADEALSIFYTSGTTGRPKAALLSSRNLISSWTSMFGAVHPPARDDRSVAHMPLAHPAERIFTVFLPVLYGCVPHIPENASTTREAMVEVSPTLLLGFPRIWETYASQVLIDVQTSGPVKRLAYRTAMTLRRRLSERLWSQDKPGIEKRVTGRLAYWGVCRPILDSFGYGTLKFVITGGAPVSPDVVRLWQMWGVNVMEIYGMTECGGLVTIQTDSVPRPGVAGRPVPGVEVRLSEEDGEILVRGRSVFQGYWKDPDATSEAIDRDGWLHTGDLGEFLEDGNLKVIDRKKDVLIVRGAVVPASETEHVIKFSPFIRDAMLVGDGRDRLVALVEMDFDTVAEWARNNGVMYSGFTSLAADERVHELIAGEIAKSNATLDERGRLPVSDFRILPKELDAEVGDEITATSKVKRRQLAAKFSHLVDEMYRTETDALIAKELRSD